MGNETPESLASWYAAFIAPFPETGLDPREFAARNAAGTTVSYLTQASLSGLSGSTTTVPSNVVTSPGAMLTLAFASSGDTTWDVTPNEALKLTLAGGTSGSLQRLTLILRQPASGGFTVTLPAVKYPGGQTPAVSTVAGHTTVITFMTDDGGTTIYGGI
ncbi:hypothetical protein [Acetobacter oeni]|uniref:Uncharacterized protein n=1 Tax=Acetobacter oeni TaxID=304077 RepID=A0A511XIS8_9PROT|nr:hypothetical protein [Acetobacter oeni]MBB3881957.1 hypothetical protein [Acetobacter oeni]NHO17723.1 hypothetical protein [Acetobacter oeni]GBR07745.1 hypothetical protein AA21952_2426 [Acetobacter oeni LMG 21952]GEN62853.1 hypothetical protein AOE01nite_10770 [Acetobacter oeni]